MRERKTTTNVIGYDYNPAFNEFIVYEQIPVGEETLREVTCYTITDIIGKPKYNKKITGGLYIGERRETIKIKTFNGKYTICIDSRLDEVKDKGEEEKEYIKRIYVEEQLDFFGRYILKDAPGSFQIERNIPVEKQIIHHAIPLFSESLELEDGGLGVLERMDGLNTITQATQNITEETPRATVHCEL